MPRKENSLKNKVAAQRKKAPSASGGPFGLPINATEKDVEEYMETLFGPDYIEKLTAKNQSNINIDTNNPINNNTNNNLDNNTKTNSNNTINNLNNNTENNLNTTNITASNYNSNNIINTNNNTNNNTYKNLNNNSDNNTNNTSNNTNNNNLKIYIVKNQKYPESKKAYATHHVQTTKPNIIKNCVKNVESTKQSQIPLPIKECSPNFESSILKPILARSEDVCHNHHNKRHQSDTIKTGIKMPSSEEIWDNYLDIKEGRVSVEESPWPISLMCHQKSNDPKLYSISPSPEYIEPEYNYNEGNKAAEDLLNWQMANDYEKPPKENYINAQVFKAMPFYNQMELSAEDDAALKDWIKSELLNEPLSDIEEYDMLLSMARDYDKNYDALFQLLKPKPVVKTDSAKDTLEACKDKSEETNPGEGNQTELDLEATPAEPDINCIEESDDKEDNEEVNIEMETPQKMEDIPIAEEIQESEDEVEEDEDQPKAEDDAGELMDPNNEILDISDISTPVQMQQSPDVVCIDDSHQSEQEHTEGDYQMDQELPEHPVILDITDLGMLPPKPEDQGAHQVWLQECSQKITDQLHHIAMSVGVSNPSSSSGSCAGTSLDTDFEMEISKEQMKPRVSFSPNRRHNHTAWQNKFVSMLDDFEDDVLQNMTEFRDPQAKRMRSKWNAQCNKTAEDLRRTLILPALPHPSNERLQKIRILRRGAPRKELLPPFPLSIDMKYVRSFCTLHLNVELDLNVLVCMVDNAIYSADIDVVQKRYEVTQLGWVWRDGTFMIINGRSQKMLFDTQNDLLPRILGINQEQSTQICHHLNYLRLTFHAQYPWKIDLIEFSRALVLNPVLLQGTDSRYVYYVNKDLPGVAARVFESGVIAVYAMHPTQADNMFQNLYMITSKFRMTGNLPVW